jgi:colanic acid biosynthesis glycosyl transferase WcaI
MDDTEKPVLWVVTELYYPEETSTGYYLTKIAEGLADRFNVKVLCGQPNYAARGTLAPRREVHRNVTIRRCRGTRLNKNIIPFRIINMLSLSTSVLAAALRNLKRGEIVLAVTTPPTMPFIAAVGSLWKGCAYVPLIHDNYPEILIAAGKTSPTSFVVSVTGHLNRWLYKHASKIIVVGRDMKKLVQKKIAGLDIPIEFIPNWAELESVKPAERAQNTLLRQLQLDRPLVFLYAGNMGYPNDLESIFSCAESLKEDPRFHFIFLGTGAKRDWLQASVSRAALKNITLLDPRPRSDQSNFLNACDVGIVSLVANMLGVSMPSRTYNLMAAGKPILAITEHNSELSLVVNENEIGWVTPPQNAQSLRNILERIYEERDTLAAKGSRARRAALEQYSLEIAVDSYAQVLGAISPMPDLSGSPSHRL